MKDTSKRSFSMSLMLKIKLLLSLRQVCASSFEFCVTAEQLLHDDHTAEWFLYTMTSIGFRMIGLLVGLLVGWLVSTTERLITDMSGPSDEVQERIACISACTEARSSSTTGEPVLVL